MIQTWIYFRGNSRQSLLITSKCRLRCKWPALLSKWILELCSLTPTRTKTDNLDCTVGFNEIDFDNNWVYMSISWRVTDLNMAMDLQISSFWAAAFDFFDASCRKKMDQHFKDELKRMNIIQQRWMWQMMSILLASLPGLNCTDPAN